MTENYFLVEKIRLNIDTNILYSAYQTKGKKYFSIYDSDIVVEIKAPLNIDMNIISNTFPFMKRRFSKYSRACAISWYSKFRCRTNI